MRNWQKWAIVVLVAFVVMVGWSQLMVTAFENHDVAMVMCFIGGLGIGHVAGLVGLLWTDAF